ncbi:phosphoenolpyruvate--protein phosphotransferase [Paenibacillus hodogayensis]|uniref:Phosphoenolpyruvate-protein phosphotransferase n=1 Tax=Paenibacillus hodogayensis TaxID=279208 RepID=A0ABV5W1D9_9BACL
MIQGLSGAPGIAIGRALLLRRKETAAKQTVLPEETGRELQRIDEAFEKTKERLQRLRAETGLKLGEREADIFAAHLAILSDPELEEEIRRSVTESHFSAEAAVEAAVRLLAEEFEAMDDAYMRERAADFRDIGQALLGQLSGADDSRLSRLEEPTVLIAYELTPSDTAQLPPLVCGFVTDGGGATSHAAIMARSLGLPAVVGARSALQSIATGDKIVADGSTGEVWVNPPEDVYRAYVAKQAEWKARLEADRSLAGAEAVTQDGRTIALGANIGSAAETANALANGAEEIGLFRTEFMYMNRDREPDEEEQTRQYEAVFRAMGDRPVVLRTLDVGGDKELPYLNLPADPNPFLGWRAIRLCLDRPGLFATQLRAMLRASAAGGLLRILFPMISTVTELRRAKEAVAQAADSLRREGFAVPERWETGIMIEIPSAALMADVLAAEVDFFSIGTNDLTQYTLAVDRMNEHISALYDSYHPAVLRLIRHVVESARGQGKRVGVCGEMAGDSSAVPLLVGLGVDELSMNAPALPSVRAVVRGLRHAEAAELAREALRLEDGRQVRELLARRRA